MGLSEAFFPYGNFQGMAFFNGLRFCKCYCFWQVFIKENCKKSTLLKMYIYTGFLPKKSKMNVSFAYVYLFKNQNVLQMIYLTNLFTVQ